MVKPSLPSGDKTRLTAHDEAHLRRETLKQFGQAFAMAYLVEVKARDRRAAKDQRIKENVELRKEVECLQDELNRSNGLLQEAEQSPTEKT